MKTKLTVIVDNIPDGNLKSEWGLSILIEYKNKKILSDVGASELFAENMKKLGYSISDIDYAVLSHAHYDHSKGMKKFFDDNQKAKFYVRESTDDNCYSKKIIFPRYIGIPKNILNDYADRIAIVSGDYQLMDGVYLIPHKTKNLEAIGKREKMYLKVNNKWIYDNFTHEQSLVIDTDKGLLIINCCCHGGVANIINEVADTFKDKHIYGIIGGFHLYNKTKSEIIEITKAIKQTNIEYICTGHCTKEKAYNIMKQELGNQIELMKSGLQIEI